MRTMKPKKPAGKVTKQAALAQRQAAVKARTEALLAEAMPDLIEVAAASADALEPYLASVLQLADRIAVEVRGETARQRRQEALLAYLQATVARQALLQSYGFAATMLRLITSRDDVAVKPLAEGYAAALRTVLATCSSDLSPLEREQIRHLKELFGAWPYSNEIAEATRCMVEQRRHERVQTNLLASGNRVSQTTRTPWENELRAAMNYHTLRRRENLRVTAKINKR
jgi:hypothetical protein